jgi:hypothetical protein
MVNSNRPSAGEDWALSTVAWIRTAPVFQSRRTNRSLNRTAGATSNSTESMIPPWFHALPAL